MQVASPFHLHFFKYHRPESKEVEQMKDVFTMSWLKCAGIRAIKTMCQTAIAMIGTSVVMSDVDWKMVISASILAGILSILTSLAGLPEVEPKAEVESK